MTASPKTVTVTLAEPIKVGKETYEKLTFRRRKAKDLVAMDLVKGELRKHMAMLASMGGVPLPVIEELDGDDYETVSRETIPLMGKSVATAMATAGAEETKAEIAPSDE